MKLSLVCLAGCVGVTIAVGASTVGQQAALRQSMESTSPVLTAATRACNDFESVAKQYVSTWLSSGRTLAAVSPKTFVYTQGPNAQGSFSPPVSRAMGNVLAAMGGLGARGKTGNVPQFIKQLLKLIIGNITTHICAGSWSRCSRSRTCSARSTWCSS